MIKEWFALACRPKVVRRALAYALIVGAVLIVINHSDAIFNGELTGSRLWRMGLTMLVPYLVSTLSSVGAMREHIRSGGSGPPAKRL